MADIFRLVVNTPCTAESVANRLGVNFESAYLGLRELREKELITDLRGEYIAAYQTGDPC